MQGRKLKEIAAKAQGRDKGEEPKRRWGRKSPKPLEP
jgi:hypothetical protein